MQIVIYVLLIWGAFAWYDSEDSEYIPYRLKGFDAYVHANGRDYYAGRAEASYWSRNEGLEICQANASYLASNMNLKDWNYVCCTVAGDSTCRTKVR